MKNLLFTVIFCIAASACFSDEVEERVKVVDSKYGELASRQVGSVYFLEANKGLAAYISMYPVVDVAWKDAEDARKATFMIFTVETDSVACPAWHVLMDARGDIPLFSQQFISCKTPPKVKKISDDSLDIYFPEDASMNNPAEHWSYDKGVLKRISK